MAAKKMGTKKVGTKRAAVSPPVSTDDQKVEADKHMDTEEIKLDEAVASSDDSEASGAEEPTKKKGKSKANRLAEAAATDDAEDDEPTEARGVIYLGHIPKGFFEPQMKTFFGQFGAVTRIRLSRSKKNAASKGYAFIEFAEESVAKIVAETMDKYLLFEKQLVCHVMAKDKVHPHLFKGWNKTRKNLSGKRLREHAGVYNDRPKVDCDGESLPQTTVRQVVRRNAKDKKLAALLGQLEVDFDVSEAGGERIRAKNPRNQKNKNKTKVRKASKAGTADKATPVAEVVTATAVSEKAAENAGKTAVAVAATAATEPAVVAVAVAAVVATEPAVVPKLASEKRKVADVADVVTTPVAAKKAFAKKKAKKV